MKVMRRVALYVVMPLAMVLAGGYGWYRLSDTGKGWRYEDKLATYCDGLIPYKESAVFTGLNTETGLSGDEEGGFGDESVHNCKVADMRLTIALIPDDAVGSGSDSDDVLDTLRPETATDALPVALGGGWHGYTNMQDAGVVLACDNKPVSVVVSIDGDAQEPPASTARAKGELAASTARKAADRWSCRAEEGGRIPPVPAPEGESSPYAASGTCRGIPIPEDQYEIDWLIETKATGTAPLENCVLGETGARSEPLYWLDASFGPFAQGLRSATDEPFAVNTDAGLERDSAWATAACPGAARAIFRISATVYADPRKGFLTTALRAFAERSAKQHGCTDLKLPD
ncbi:hypothetical protein [Streptomyces sp. NL15-2K]|uniref:hypothetical protein n=1 Tax=Streptomyces sp. NL15-2K TaxID=376149 RepID=UPI000F55B8DE|nr:MULTISPECIES: hypothetical protein [Actinomycetes]WKX08958.1 hypothetical protein Q4V64_16230 [Kutzneria buriramensis]GCB49548.1 hypothetical protein SNL152K_6887 [Streptomyces sp. NL15-2K]